MFVADLEEYGSLSDGFKRRVNLRCANCGSGIEQEFDSKDDTRPIRVPALRDGEYIYEDEPLDISQDLPQEGKEYFDDLQKSIEAHEQIAPKENGHN